MMRLKSAHTVFSFVGKERDRLMNPRKAAIIGCGHVGASIAFALMQRALFSEMVLIDVDRRRAEGEALDLSHGLPYTAAMDVYAGDYDDMGDAAIAIITAGVSQKPGESRLDLTRRNVVILEEIIHNIRRTEFEGILLIVSNPVDVLTWEAQRISGYPAHRVIGSGTVLDTGRLKYLLGRNLNVDPRSIHAFVIGEHGDSELTVWSSANVSGIDLENFCALRSETECGCKQTQVDRDVRESAQDIICRKGATYYGIAMATARICESIVKDEQAVLPVSTILHGEYGLSGLSLSVPAVIGVSGVETVLEIPLSQQENEALVFSAKRLLEVISSLDTVMV